MLLIHGKIYGTNSGIIENGFVEIQGEKIVRAGPMEALNLFTADAVNLQGKRLLPGFIDAHAHLGMWEDSLGFEGDDGNEDTDPSTPHLRAIDAVNPFDRCFHEALTTGITTVITGPGSANPVGGQMVAMKTYGNSADDMILSPLVAVKFALGENPKSVYHGKNQSPVTRMATAAIIREQLYKARRYYEDLQSSREDPDLDRPEYDMKCEALIPLLERKCAAHFHAHRADDIQTALRIGREFNIQVVIVHCTEGRKVAGQLAERGIPALCGPLLCDRSKPELRELSPATPGILCAAGVKTALVTDHPVVPIQYLPLTAGLAIREGLPEEEALLALTRYPAEICGISRRVGSIEAGKDADLVCFRDNPFGVEAAPEMVIAGGRIVE